MIQFFKVSKAYGENILFSDATFTLGKRERCGIVGRNGSGKSTLFRMITGEEVSDSGTITIPKNYRIGTLQQYLSFHEENILKEALSSLPKEEQDQEYRAEITLTGLGFKLSDMERAPSEFSGGFQLRLQLAKTLLAEPDCLLLDEPTNYLDIVAIRWLEGILRQWHGEFMVISHDRNFLDSITTHTLGIYREKVTKLAGSVGKFYTDMLIKDEVHERTQQKAQKKREHLQSYIDRFGAKATKAAQAQSKQKALDKMGVMERLAAIENLKFTFKTAPFLGKRFLDVEHLHFSYDASSFEIRDFSLSIQMKDRIAIIGKNGRGKSTLLALLAGILKPKSGEWIGSENLRMGYFGQTNINRLDVTMTVEEEIASANPDLNYGEVRSICGQMMFSGDLAKKTISLLSGGERSRVLLGKILATKCNLLLLDEPTHHLDMESVEALFQAIKKFPGAVVLVTHDESVLTRFAERLVVCRQDSIDIFDGDYPTFLEKVGWETDTSVSSPKQKAVTVQNPAKKKIREYESAIMRAEEHLADATQQLEQAVELGDHKQMDTYSRQVAKYESMIEDLFAQLEALNDS